ncbi:sigma-54-dependent Fis family transcriptional regulator [Halovibrio salipaludis]|uniref:Sigma-54-dependent Fis family transcriptional regulator n=1 Tax=Halovibrio salipaludis TaxID=2032626 RepID=A0A2A2F8Y4_9GAMM|nr:sigma-54 dependent transcriptional regulator [Halovibrio salipaludis]PAU81418.1 sigma-54-dependent Fis family transcriptional regulator [Halovibrio salipaludis]
MAKQKILIVEDDGELREALVTTLEVKRYRVSEAASGEQALEKLASAPVDLVISDVQMPGMDGISLLAEIQRHHPGIPVLLMTAYGRIEQAVSAMQAGAVDYLAKPFEPQVLTDIVSRVLGGPASTSANRAIAEDAASRRMFQLARKVAATDSTVLICGESGTGKEVLARYIHDESSRASQPFVALNCAAIPENMLEAILFGHEKGAFTGAHQTSPGKFEQANGGTLLLDEISEMEIGLQAKLLRVLQEREVERVGGRRSIQLDVRVIATTNRDLQEDVAAGRFREDLYYRLGVFPLQWLPLRERRDDILPLAEHLLEKHARQMHMTGVTLDPSARRVIYQYDWPGNVRELDNAIQRALILQQGQVITDRDLSLDQSITGAAPAPRSAAPEPDTDGPVDPGTVAEVPETDAAGTDEAQDASLGDDLRQREFRIILQTLRDERGRRKQAAERLGISPRTLRYKLAQMRDHGINPEEELAFV